jgi:hypothetical protein
MVRQLSRPLGLAQRSPLLHPSLQIWHPAPSIPVHRTLHLLVPPQPGLRLLLRRYRVRQHRLPAQLPTQPMRCRRYLLHHLHRRHRQRDLTDRHRRTHDSNCFLPRRLSLLRPLQRPDRRRRHFRNQQCQSPRTRDGAQHYNDVSERRRELECVGWWVLMLWDPTMRDRVC